MPAGSKTDPPLAKAEPISNSGSASVITYLRKSKRSYRGVAVAARESGVRRCERNNSADTKVREEGGGGGAPGARAETPLQPLERPHGSRFPDRNCGLWRTCTGEDPFFLKD